MATDTPPHTATGSLSPALCHIHTGLCTAMLPLAQTHTHADIHRHRHRHTCICIKAQRHTYADACQHTQLCGFTQMSKNTSGHRGTQWPRNTQAQAYKHTDTLLKADADTHTESQTLRDTCRDVQTLTAVQRWPLEHGDTGANAPGTLCATQPCAGRLRGLRRAGLGRGCPCRLDPPDAAV